MHRPASGSNPVETEATNATMAKQKSPSDLPKLGRSTSQGRRDSEVSNAAAPSPSTVAWWRVANRLRVFVFGVLVGVFVVRPFQAQLEHPLPYLRDSSVTSDNAQHISMDESLLSKSKSSFIRSSHNSTLTRRQQRLAEEGAQAVASADTEPKKTEIVDFERQPKVAIVTKVHGASHMKQLIQSMCLLNVAYNNRPRYDIIVFVTEAISAADTSILREVAYPANIEVVFDSGPLSKHLKKLRPNQLKYLMQRCNVTSKDDLYWWTRCSEAGSGGQAMPISYSWQSEFRALHIWQREELKPYKWMLWFDSDAFPTEVWQQDPVAFMIRNELRMLFCNFPMGSSAGEDLRLKIKQAYGGDTLCKLNLVNGKLVAEGGSCVKPRIPNIHGFFHLTDLDFYRNKENLGWSKIMIGDNKFSRRWDDQLAVTIPAAMRANGKAWDMNSNNMTLNVYHNAMIDGHRRWKTKEGKFGYGFQKWWKDHGKDKFPEAVDQCHKWIRNGG